MIFVCACADMAEKKTSPKARNNDFMKQGFDKIGRKLT
jgi:hypothetical protein